MVNNTQEINNLSTLFAEASKEIIERSRIKSQMRKLRTIMESDKKRLQSAYAELGKIFYEGTENKNAARVEVLKKLIKHLISRIEKAEIRLVQLEVARSLDDCTQALKTELSSKLNTAKAATTGIAKDLQEKAKKKADSLKKSVAKDKITLTREQDRAIFKAIKKELENDPETKETAEDTLSKIHDILDSLAEDEPEKETVAAIPVPDEAEKAPQKKDEVAEDFTF